jgi:hypothetical protein
LTSVSQATEKSSQLSWSSRPDIGLDVGKDAVGGGAIRYVRRDGRNSEAGLDGLECVRPPGNHGDLCAFGHKRFNQAQTKAATSTGDDCALIFETHVLCSNICEAKTIDG